MHAKQWLCLRWHHPFHSLMESRDIESWHFFEKEVIGFFSEWSHWLLFWMNFWYEYLLGSLLVGLPHFGQDSVSIADTFMRQGLCRLFSLSGWAVELQIFSAVSHILWCWAQLRNSPSLLLYPTLVLNWNGSRFSCPAGSGIWVTELKESFGVLWRMEESVFLVHFGNWVCRVCSQCESLYWSAHSSLTCPYYRVTRILFWI